MTPALVALWLLASRPLSWTVPTNAPTRSVEVVVRDAAGVDWARPAFADSALTRPHVPKSSGRDTAWVLEPPGQFIHWVRLCNTAGCSDWSNRMVGAVVGKDTLWTVVRGTGSRPMQSYPWQRSTRGRVGFSLAPGDSARATIYHQEAMQRAASARLVALYGFWALRGVPVTVPDNDPPRVDP